MTENNQALNLIKSQMLTHRERATKKHFKFMNLFSRQHSSGRFSIDANSAHKTAMPNNNNNVENNTNQNVERANNFPIEPSFFAVSESDRQLFKSKFKFPKSEQLHAVYHCALFKSFDFNGKLFLSDNYICFYNTNIIDHFSKQDKVRHNISITSINEEYLYQ